MRPVISVFILALVARVTVAIGIAVFAGGTLVPDDLTYSDMAAAAADGSNSEWDPYTRWLYGATATLLLPITGIYELLGPTKIAGQLFVASIGAGAAAAVTGLALLALERRWAVLAGILVALLPSQIVWSSLIMKDAVVWFVVTATGYAVAKMAGRRDWRVGLFALLVATLLFLLAYLRLHTLVVVAWAVVLASWFGSRRTRWARVAAATVVAVSIPWIVGIGPIGATLVANAGSLAQRRALNAVGARTAVVDIPASEPTPAEDPISDLTADEQERISEELGVETSDSTGLTEAIAALAESRPEQLRELAEEAGVPPGRLLALVRQKEVPPDTTVVEAPLAADIEHIPRGLSVMLVEPLPWSNGESTAFQLARLEMLIWYPLLLLAVAGLPHALKRPDVMFFPLVAGAGVLVTYALTEGNVGTAFRHRGEIVWTVALLAAFGARAVVPWVSQRWRG